MEYKTNDRHRMLGSKLKRAIQESPYRTQASFAEAFHSDERTVRRWCRGEIDKLSLVWEIADFLKIDALALLSA